MCGIAGAIGVEQPRSKAGLMAMKANLSRRGPDACGYWESTRAALLHTRLSVIDLDGSKQPMPNEDGTVLVVFNGEIYNFVSIRKRLIERGHVFRTKGDTELLVHLYEEAGTEMCEQLDGMFAFALYDVPQHRLLLVRDRAGIKPLYYWYKPDDGELLFASDLGAMLANPCAPRKLNLTALAQFFQFGYAIHPHSWIEQVNQLEPGQTLLWNNGAIAARRYYAWNYEPDSRMTRRATAVRALEEAADKSVRSQLAADVRLGSFLSGGLDSSTVTAFAQRARSESGDRISTFTVRFDHESFDESVRARAIAGELGTFHTEINGEGLPFDRRFLGELADCTGEPFGDVSALPTYALCRDVRREIKVALSGDGGDEIFLGYSGLSKQRIARRARVLPGGFRRFLTGLPGSGGGAFVRRAHKYLRLSLADDPGLIIEWARRWRTDEMGCLLSSDVLPAFLETHNRAVEEVRAIIGAGKQGGFSEQQARFHLLVDLPCDCLLKVDRMAMAHGLEVRVPLLSNAMLEYAARLPLSMRRYRGKTKEPLRTVAEAKCHVLAKPSPKRGFEFPLENWVRPRLAIAWRDWNISAKLSEIGFNAKAVDGTVRAYTSTPSAHRRNWLAGRLFDLLLLAVWADDHSVTVN
ncbi:MAG TPA: asparagine synthase (glutamine-hydrolyzing) [Bryobacteraceae bacterium]|nr:asparagine synthase (glutamine-hydrolyzing) [Bryobacteraceae bacterium]